MPIPEFVIVGAPKCGTTALFEYLGEHPELHLPFKEPHHFGSDLRPEFYRGGRRDLNWYYDKLKGAAPGQLTGEASVWYLYSKKAAEEIYAHNPDAKIIIMLREPASMMYSLYNMFMWVRDLVPNGVLYETNVGAVKPLTFEEALANQDERKAEFESMRDLDAERGVRARRIFHTEVAKYTEQVQRYLDVFPRDQVKIVLLDDIKADVAKVYRESLEFIGVKDTAFKASFEVVNSSREIKSYTLHRLMLKHDSLPALRTVIKALTPQGLRRKVFHKVLRRNVTHKKQPLMQAETRAWLKAHFRDEVEHLAGVIDRDLVKLWYKDAPRPATPPPAKLELAEA
ncbi:MAG: sulfotransferase domain-containing protein [Bacteroidota bacterium]